MNCQTLFLPDTDIFLQHKVSNRGHAGCKEGDHVDLYIHGRPAIGGDRVSSVVSCEWDLFHIPLHYSFSVGSIVPVLVALLLNYLCKCPTILVCGCGTLTPSHARVPFFFAIQTWNMQDRYRFGGDCLSYFIDFYLLHAWFNQIPFESSAQWSGAFYQNLGNLRFFC